MAVKQYSYYDLTGDKNPYHWMLEQAGAKVLAFADFGSYQGDWLAKVEYKGKKGWIQDYYGSCSGCDAWEGEVGYEDRTKLEWKLFCIEFAKDYLDEIKTEDEVLKAAGENDWDLNVKEMVVFIKSHKQS